MPYYPTSLSNLKLSRSLICGAIALSVLFCSTLKAQEVQKNAGNTAISIPQLTISADKSNGAINYTFSNGTRIDNAVAYVEDINSGYLSTANLANHQCTIEQVNDKIGKGLCLTVKHSDAQHSISITQQFKLFNGKQYALVSVSATSAGKPIETRNISALAVSPAVKGKLFIPGTEPRILDVPFDNDDWTPTLQRHWPKAGEEKTKGISYEFLAVYDQLKNSGLVIGSVNHDFWKTGLSYQAATEAGYVDSLNVFGGVATADNPALKSAYGGLDGTHDHTLHGTALGQTVSSATIYLCASDNLHEAFKDYGRVNSIINGARTWQGGAPVYWNSFGVEGVLGYEKVMMPPAVYQISDFLHSMPNFSAYAKPVLSVDSYDQGLYTTEVLKEIGEYGAKNGQQMGFYFSPFAMWSWKNNTKNAKIPGTNQPLESALLHDKDGKAILYKDGDWGAYALDPTHPGVRLSIIQQLKKAKAINAKFLKIDFLTAGALESTTRHDVKIRTGMQAYNYGMQMLKHLCDSIMGKDIFITQAISPLFPHQYAHTRFVSTDVYSHLRDDQKSFPGWGSTESSLAAGSHLGWMQGTLFPYTNLDVAIMKNFQRNPDLNEQEIKVRLYAMMVMGSILGDGSDYRNPIAAFRAQEFLNNKNIAKYFSDPKAFTPIKMADGESFDQQMAFYLPGDNTLAAAFNFDLKNDYKQLFSRSTLKLPAGKGYQLLDFMSDKPLGELKADAAEFTMVANPGDAVLVKLVPLK